MVRVLDDSRLADLTRMLRESADPTRIILFGSHARGHAQPDSDLDVMVVLRGACDRVAETVRLGRVISVLRLPVDLLVVSEDTFTYWRHTPGNIYSAASAEGQVLYEQSPSV
jgi:predicted nucleotidyltransferase